MPAEPARQRPAPPRLEVLVREDPTARPTRLIQVLASLIVARALAATAPQTPDRREAGGAAEAGPPPKSPERPAAPRKK
jgi:hypothetical protein